MFMLKDKIKKNIAKKTGLTFDQISSMSSDEINKHLEALLNKTLPMGYPEDSLAARGSVYINTKRLITPEETEESIAHHVNST